MKAWRVFPLRALCALTLLLILGPAASAAAIYGNGLPDTHNGYGILGSSATSDDFTLVASANIYGIAFYFQNYQGITGWNQDINYAFYLDNGGQPLSGAALASGSAVNLTAVDSGMPWCCPGQPGGDNAWLVTFDLQAPFFAAAGTTYWLELSGATGTASSAWWVTAPANATYLGWNGSVGVPGTQTAYQFAFMLYDTPFGEAQIPEPSTFVLIGLGGLALAATRRFSRR